MLCRIVSLPTLFLISTFSLNAFFDYLSPQTRAHIIASGSLPYQAAWTLFVARRLRAIPPARPQERVRYRLISMRDYLALLISGACERDQNELFELRSESGRLREEVARLQTKNALADKAYGVSIESYQKELREKENNVMCHGQRWQEEKEEAIKMAREQSIIAKKKSHEQAIIAQGLAIALDGAVKKHEHEMTRAERKINEQQESLHRIQLDWNAFETAATEELKLLVEDRDRLQETVKSINNRLFALTAVTVPAHMDVTNGNGHSNHHHENIDAISNGAPNGATH